MPNRLFNAAPRWGAVLLLAVFAIACAKIADPQPPRTFIPVPIRDLAVHQVADSIVLTFKKPARNTDGSETRMPALIEVFRLAADKLPNDMGKPLREDLFLQQAARIRSIEASNSSPFLRGDFFIIEDKPELPNSGAFFSRVFRYAVIVSNKRNLAAGLSNQAFIAPIPIPLAPDGLAAEMAEDAIHLQWNIPDKNMDGSTPPRIAGYDIFRSEDQEAFPPTPLNADPLRKPEFEDRSFEFDRVYFYAVRIVGSVEKPYAVSRLSETLRVEARDMFPPGPPEDFQAIRENGSILLLWLPSKSKDVAGYRIHRREGGKGTHVLLEHEDRKSVV